MPTNAIVYTLEEAEVLADRSEWTPSIVHEAKKRGARVAPPQITYYATRIIRNF